jgi:hypothetical protein
MSTITREFTLPQNDKTVEWRVAYTAGYEDHSFAHEFGTHYQGGFEVETWELTISKLVGAAGWRAITLTMEQVPEALYSTIDELCVQHLAKNPVDG